MMNKIVLFGLTGFAITGLAATSSFAGECSEDTVKGHYTYWLQGSDSSGKMYAEVGQEHYDGNGKIVAKIAVSGVSKTEDDTGTYIVNADCTGTSTYASGATYNFMVSPSGDSFVFVSSKEGVIQAGENTRVGTDTE